MIIKMYISVVYFTIFSYTNNNSKAKVPANLMPLRNEELATPGKFDYEADIVFHINQES